MKVLGIDPSSSISGNALVVHGRGEPKLRWTECWFKEKKLPAVRNLHNYFLWQQVMIEDLEADMACVESLSVARGAQVTRVLSHFQAAAVLACKEAGITVVEARVSQGRLWALGDGSLDKDEAHEAVKKMFPKHKFRQKKNGGYDETDATVLGLSGPHAAEL